MAVAVNGPLGHYTIRYGAQPIGFIQTYPLRAYPDYATLIGIEDEAAGIDLFIGEADYAYRGLGAPLLRAFLRQVVFTDPAIDSCIIDPEINNTSAIRAYEKAGFIYLKTIQAPDELAPQYVMRWSAGRSWIHRRTRRTGRVPD